GLFDLAIAKRRLALGGNTKLGPAFGADPLFAGQKRLDVEFMSVGTMKLDSHGTARRQTSMGPTAASPLDKTTAPLYTQVRPMGCSACNLFEIRQMPTNEATPEPPPLEIAVSGDLTEHEGKICEKLLAVPLGGECVLYFNSPGGSAY